MEYGIWNMEYGIWNMELNNKKFESQFRLIAEREQIF